MKKLRALIGDLSATERRLWEGSMLLIVAAFCVFDRENVLTLIASLVGVTSLIFAAKGHPLSQALMIVFSLLYGFISWEYRYYGEMITYLGMTLPMAVMALVSWLRHPFKGERREVAVGHVGKREIVFLCFLTALVTAVFYGGLAVLGTANLLVSTVSVMTSFAAAYLTFRRSPYYALAYAANDVVLIVLWILAAREDHTYISMVVCFAAFLVNDLYGFVRWRRMAQRQQEQ